MLNFVDGERKDDILLRLRMNASFHIQELETKIMCHPRDFVLSTYFMRKIGEEISDQDRPLFLNCALESYFFMVLIMSSPQPIFTFTQI